MGPSEILGPPLRVIEGSSRRDRTSPGRSSLDRRARGRSISGRESVDGRQVREFCPVRTHGFAESGFRQPTICAPPWKKTGGGRNHRPRKPGNRVFSRREVGYSIPQAGTARRPIQSPPGHSAACPGGSLVCLNNLHPFRAHMNIRRTPGGVKVIVRTDSYFLWTEIDGEALSAVATSARKNTTHSDPRLRIREEWYICSGAGRSLRRTATLARVKTPMVGESRMPAVYQTTDSRWEKPADSRIPGI